MAGDTPADPRVEGWRTQHIMYPPFAFTLCVRPPLKPGAWLVKQRNPPNLTRDKAIDSLQYISK